MLSTTLLQCNRFFITPSRPIEAGSVLYRLASFTSSLCRIKVEQHQTFQAGVVSFVHPAEKDSMKGLLSWQFPSKILSRLKLPQETSSSSNLTQQPLKSDGWYWNIKEVCFCCCCWGEVFKQRRFPQLIDGLPAGCCWLRRTPAPSPSSCNRDQSWDLST